MFFLYYQGSMILLPKGYQSILVEAIMPTKKMVNTQC
jgi:hypothetical protein